MKRFRIWLTESLISIAARIYPSDAPLPPKPCRGSGWGDSTVQVSVVCMGNGQAGVLLRIGIDSPVTMQPTDAIKVSRMLSERAHLAMETDFSNN